MDALDLSQLPPALPPAVLLRAARHMSYLSQRELADKAGVNRAVVGRIESGATASPSFAVMSRLLRAAGCPLVAFDPGGLPLEVRPHDDAVDKGYRRWPGHLDVRRVHDAGDWWFGYQRPAGAPLPQYTADWNRLKGRPRARRRTKAEIRAAARAALHEALREAAARDAAPDDAAAADAAADEVSARGRSVSASPDGAASRNTPHAGAVSHDEGTDG